MKTIIKKLNSKRGVSIVMALLLALICLFAGAAALTAASSNIGRYEHLRKDNQEYLSISSAARLLSEQFADDGSKISANCSSGATVISYATSFPAGGHVYKLLETSFMKPLLLYCYNLGSGGTPSSTPPSVEFTVDDDEASGDDNFQTVDVKVSAENLGATSADINVELYVLEKDKPDELKYRKRTLKFTVELTFTSDLDNKTISITTAKVQRITLPGKLEGTP